MKVDPEHILVIDQGTSSTRAIIYDLNFTVVSAHSCEFEQAYPHLGWVEQCPFEIWQSVLETVRESLRKATLDMSNILAVGITNQRETTVLWDRDSGIPSYNAIVWQDRRTASYCDALSNEENAAYIKINWTLNHVPDAKTRALAGEICFGTIDSWFIYKLTKGQAHKTDITNASRTLLYDINNLVLDQRLLNLLESPVEILPEVHENDANFGYVHAELFGYEVPIVALPGTSKPHCLDIWEFTRAIPKSRLVQVLFYYIFLAINVRLMIKII